MYPPLPPGSSPAGPPATGTSKEQIYALTGVTTLMPCSLCSGYAGTLSTERALDMLGLRGYPEASRAIIDKATVDTMVRSKLSVMLTQMEVKKCAINRANTLHSNMGGDDTHLLACKLD